MTNPTMEQAVEQNYDDILWYFVYRVRNRAAAEDLTQETFYRFLRYSAGTARFRTPQKCRAYLFAIASNVCRDYYAKSADAAAELAVPERETLIAAIDEMLFSLRQAAHNTLLQQKNSLMLLERQLLSREPRVHVRQMIMRAAHLRERLHLAGHARYA